jgi:dTDP-4-amino-4,6-dideoxygalactose transaminase
MEFRDLKKQYLKYKEQIDSAIEKVLVETNFIGGLQVSELEGRLAKYVGVKHCVSCANGTDALYLVLMAWGIGVGDAVFVPDFTFYATAEVVAHLGATPIFVDVDPVTFNMNPLELKKKIISISSQKKLKPKVVIPVDLFGLPANYEEIETIAKEYNLLVLEDAAQGFGGVYNKKQAGSFGDAAITSFFPAKPLGCYGDGGAIFTNNDELANHLESLKVHGKGIDKYDNVRIGLNSRLDTIQAAILNVKLTAFIEHELGDVNQIYNIYNTLLHNHVDVPIIPEGYLSSFAQYTIKLNSEEQRTSLRNFLAKKGVPSMIYYSKPMHKQPVFHSLENSDDDYPVSVNLSNTVLSLPMHPYLEESEVYYIANCISEFFAKNGNC